MECKFCTTENSEGAVFCKRCGRRLDGKTVCPACKSINDYDAQFCNQCGAAIKSTNVKLAARNEGGAKWRKIVGLISGCLGMAGVLFSLIFVFLIGVQADVAVSGTMSSVSSSVSAQADAGFNIYYYFGDAYTTLETTLDKMDSYEASYFLACYYPTIIATVVAALTLIGVLTFTVLATVRFVRKMTGKSEKDYGTFVAATALSYLAGIAAFFSLHATHMKTSSPSSLISSVLTEIDVSTGLNGATTAGIVLVVLCLVSFLVLKVVADSNTWKEKNHLISFCLTAAAFVLFSVAFGVISMGIAEAILTENQSFTSFAYATETTLTGGGYDVINSLIVGTSGEILEEQLSVLYLAVAGQLVQIAAIAALAAVIVKLFGALTGEKSDLVSPVVATPLVIVHMVLSVVTCVSLIDTLSFSQNAELSITYAMPIVALVFTVIAAAAAIVAFTFMKQSKKEVTPFVAPIMEAPAPVAEPAQAQTVENNSDAEA